MSKFTREEPNPATWSCWNRGSQPECLRVETTEHSFWILPYTHLVSARYEKGVDSEKLAIEFSTHSVNIEGENLRDLALAFQKCSVEWLRPVPGRYSPVIPNQSGFIRSIRVTSDRGDDGESA